MILAVVTSCRRKDNIPLIIKCLKNQTLPPDLIWVFYNGDDPLPNNFECDNIICSNNSKHALSRFSVGLSVDCEYVYYLDDDVFPEHGYLENCFKFISKKRCIIGSSGLVLSALDETENQVYHGFRFWHKYPNYTNLTKENQIDFPLHSYFMTRKDLLSLFEFPIYNQITERGAEIRLASRAWICNRTNCYVVPQEKGCYGETDFVQPMSKALFMDSEFFDLRNQIIKKELELGWKPIFNRKIF